MKNNPYLSYYIHRFLVWFLPNVKGVSENTILAYRDALKLLLKYCNEHLKLKIDKLSYSSIDENIVYKFLDHLEKERACTPKTRNARLAAIKAFFYYLGSEAPECLDNSRRINSIPLKRVPHKTVDYLETEELSAILDCIDVTAHQGYRDRALLLFLHNTGARAQETIDVKLDDLRFDAASQVKIIGKGNRHRVCPLWPETVKAINDYLSERRPAHENENHLFLNTKGNRITRFGIGYVIKKYTDKAITIQPSLKKKKVTPHTFRHTTAMHLLQSGNELNMVRLWLGHKSLNTTHMYVEIDMKLKNEILNKCQPLEMKQKHKKWQQPEILDWLDKLCSGEKLCEVNPDELP